MPPIFVCVLVVIASTLEVDTLLGGGNVVNGIGVVPVVDVDDDDGDPPVDDTIVDKCPVDELREEDEDVDEIDCVVDELNEIEEDDTVNVSDEDESVDENDCKVDIVDEFNKNVDGNIDDSGTVEFGNRRITCTILGVWVFGECMLRGSLPTSEIYRLGFGALLADLELANVYCVFWPR